MTDESDATIDAFKRLRVSQPFTIFDASPPWTSHAALFNSKINGQGGSVERKETNTLLTCGNDKGSYVIDQTWEYFPHQCGKSQLVMITIDFGETDPRFIKRAGLFDDEVGVFFAVDGRGLACCARFGPQETLIFRPKTTCNARIFFFDFQWLGIGRVRMGVVEDGIPKTLHNFIDYNTAMMQSAALPIRFSINRVMNDEDILMAPSLSASPSSSCYASMRALNAVVITEGGKLANGYQFSITNGDVGCRVGRKMVPIISVRLKKRFAGHINRIFAKMQKAMVIASHDVSFQVVYNSKLIGCIWQSVTKTSGMEYDIAASDFQDGVVIFSGYCIRNLSSAPGMIDFELSDKRPLGVDIDGEQSVIISIVASRIGSKSSIVYGGFTWKEIQ